MKVSEQPSLEKDSKSVQVQLIEPSQNENTNESPSIQLSACERTIEKFWLFEIFAFIVSIIGLVAVIITLKITDGHRMPRWNLKAPSGKTSTVTINAILSIFSTMIKSTVLIPVAAAMGELKWMWFRDGHELTDVQIFEGAARGPWGATVMLWKFRGKNLACLGAVIVFSSLILDFAFQQLVTYPLQATPVGSSTIARTNDYNASRPGHSTSLGVAELPMLAAVYNGLYSTNTSFAPVPGCTTGNCTWNEHYTSLGVCSKCYDTTDLLIKTCSTFNYTTVSENNQRVVGDPISYCNYSTPSGQRILGWNGTGDFGQPSIVPIVVNSAGMPASNMTYFGKRPVSQLTTFSVIRASWELLTDEQQRTYYSLRSANASECGLEFCVLKYQGVTKQAQFMEQVIDTFINATAFDPNGQPSVTIIPPKTFTNKSDGDVDSIYSVGFSTYMALTNGLFTQQSETYPTMWDGTFTQGDGNTVDYTSDFMSLLRYSNDTELNSTMKSLAAAMTRRMRVFPGDSTNIDGPGPTAFGTTFQDVPHVRVRWVWITLPAVILILSAVFLSATMVLSSREGANMLWKANGLAHYYYPLTKDNRDKVATATSAKHFELLADNMKVKYEETTAGGRFVPVQ